jgi:hypothetical protein
VDVVEAFDATSWFDPVSVSFGVVRANRPFTATRTVAIGGAGAASVDVQFDVAPPAGLTLTASTTASVLSATLSLDRTVGNGDYSGDLVVIGTDSRTYRIPFWVRVTGR